MNGSTKLAAVFLPALFGLATAALAQIPQAQHVRGTIDGFDGQILTIRSNAGENVKVTLGPNYTVTKVTKATLADVTSGKYVGVSTSPPAAGPLRALEIHTFPSEGPQFFGDWDLIPNGGMANGDVSAVVDQVQNNLLTLTINGQPKQIIIPRGIPIVAFTPGDKSMLTPGAHVVLSAAKQADGSFLARNVDVGVDGTVPPL